MLLQVIHRTHIPIDEYILKDKIRNAAQAVMIIAQINKRMTIHLLIKEINTVK